MFSHIKKYHRYEDYYSGSFEVKMALSFVLLFSVILLGTLDFYNQFNLYSEVISNVLLYIVAGEFGLIGMSLAGMAIITSLVTPEVQFILNETDKDNDVVGRLMSEFEFSALNLIIQLFYLILIIISFSSNRPLINRTVFYFLFIIVLYHLFFNIFYIAALIVNCTKINNIKNKCYLINKKTKTSGEIANEVRIDFMLSIILKENNINRDELLRYLDDIVDKSNIIEKEEIKKYFHNYYGN